ncbi:unnamed protein product [Miscanthus lutarioriparius]|uniref:HMA domain-containing protein n=1 Tax=Miscanthus lutarioriparius TaxID=422564 RepID=A0A811ML60_9POAL|nr:unnamed protein product [Miscanthus lutarioriparius]
MVTAVLKVDMHCDGYAKCIHGSVHRYLGKQRNLSYLSVVGATPSCDVRQGGGSGGWNGMEWNRTYANRSPKVALVLIDSLAGVEGVAMEVDKGSMTVVGRFDAKKLRDHVADKTRKTVDLVGGGSSSNNKGRGTGGGGNQQKKSPNNEDGKQEGKGSE